MQDFEKLGVFYLGKLFDLKKRQTQEDLLLYKSQDLTTHAVCVGMTGSGKTGLCLTLLEEAAIDGIPAIAIDPKGDLGNLLLTFPELKPADFRPWIDADEAARKGQTPDDFAAATAKRWHDGLAEWGQDPARIAKFRSAVDLSIYTPGSRAGLPLAVLRSFAAPPKSIADDSEALRERVTAAVSGLLALLGLEADPLRSREHILISNILDRVWREGRSLDLAGMVREIQSPALEKIGAVDLETFFPAKDRFALAMNLNNLLASPSAAAWMEGEPLDIGRLLFTREGKPRLSVISIAHLSDNERMFFVTVLLNEMIAWMRTQSGTSSLRALLYMDEVFGYFPPTANPPSKTPMLTLLKQARAFGLGVVLATQNPVDLDYKGLSNAGTWFLGRLQTERDKARVLDGLAGASAAAGANFDREAMANALSALGNRVFLMNNVHDDHPVVFQVRWTLSYLRGPITREQIQMLMAPRKQSEAPPVSDPAKETPRAAGVEADSGPRPLLPPGISEFFLPSRQNPTEGKLVYRPALVGRAKVHFVDAKTGTDVWRNVMLLAPAVAGGADSVWEQAKPPEEAVELEQTPEAEIGFAPLASDWTRAKSYTSWGAALKSHLYREQTLALWKSAEPKACSQPDEDETAFRLRIAHSARETRDSQVDDLAKRLAPKLAAVKEQIRRAQQRVEKEKSQYHQQTFQAGVSLVTSLVGAFLGRKLTSASNVTRAGTAVRAAGRAAREHEDVGQAEETVEALQQKLVGLEEELHQDSERVQLTLKPESLALEQIQLKPRKADISVEQVALVWIPSTA